QDVKEEKIPVWIPLLFQVQPIAKPARNQKLGQSSLIPQSGTAGAHQKGGINSSAAKKLKVKGVPASKAQLTVGETILETGQSMNATIQMMIAAIAAATQESDMANL